MIMRLRSYLNTAAEDLRFQGRSVFLWRVFVKLCSPLAKVDLQILFEIDLRQPIEQRQARVPCSITPAGEADLDEILDLQLQVPPPETLGALSDREELQYARRALAREKAKRAFLQAMRAGEQCFVARVGDRIAHSNWIRFHDCRPVDGRPVELAIGEVYTTDAYTGDPWRGMGLHEAVLTHMLRHAQQRGCHRAYTITDLFKAGSRRGVKRIGWRQRGRILYVTPRGLGRTWLLRAGGDLEPMFRHARAMLANT
jgi:GNAT superfamily N-acetyltransferase